MTDYTDSFTGTNGDAWASPWVTAKRTGSGTSTIDTNRGKQVASTTGSYSDYETQRYGSVTTADGTISGTVRFPTDNEVFAQCWMRGDTTLGTPGGGGGNGYFFSIEPSYNQVRLYKRVGGTQTALGSGAVAFTLAAATDYSWKMECTGTTVRAKIWTGSEPGSWTQSVTDSSHSTGYVGLGIDGGAAAGTAWRADWDGWLFSTPTPSVTLTGSSSAAGVLARGFAKTFAGSTSSVGVWSYIKVVERLFDATVAASGAFAKQVGKALSGSTASTGTFAKGLARTFASSTTAAGAFSKAFVRVWTGSVTATGSVVTTFLGRVFGRPGIITTVASKAGEVLMRIRRT